MEGCAPGSAPDAAILATVADFFEHAITPDWVQPSIFDIYEIAGKDGTKDAHHLAQAKQLHATFDTVDMVWKVDGKVLIPPGPIRKKLMIMAHCQSSGHRARETTYEQPKQFVYWTGMRKDVDEFIERCPFCKAAAEKQFVKRPYGKQITPSARNEILSLDNLSLPASADGFNSIVVVMDKLSSFMLLHPVKSENAVDTAERGVMDWVAKFGIPDYLLSDQGPGFNNKVLDALTKTLQIDHHIGSSPLGPWQTGAGAPGPERDLPQTTDRKQDERDTLA